MSDVIKDNNLWVTIVVILFTLSLIAERIGNLIKLFFSSTRDRAWTEESEKRRELKVLIIALSSGMIVSAVAGADLFILIDKAKLVNYPLKDWRSIPGIVLSGFFISLGSKFWHDMLDIVLQFSELKKYRVLNEKNSSFQALRAQDEYVRRELAERAAIIEPDLKKLPGFKGLTVQKNIDTSAKIYLTFAEQFADDDTKARLARHFSPAKVEYLTSDTRLL